MPQLPGLSFTAKGCRSNGNNHHTGPLRKDTDTRQRTIAQAIAHIARRLYHIPDGEKVPDILASTRPRS